MKKLYQKTNNTDLVDTGVILPAPSEIDMKQYFEFDITTNGRYIFITQDKLGEPFSGKCIITTTSSNTNVFQVIELTFGTRPDMGLYIYGRDSTKTTWNGDLSGAYQLRLYAPKTATDTTAAAGALEYYSSGSANTPKHVSVVLIGAKNCSFIGPTATKYDDNKHNQSTQSTCSSRIFGTGLQGSCDTATEAYNLKQNGNLYKAAASMVGYCLCFETLDGRLYPISSYDGSSSATATKTLNKFEYRIGSPIFYKNGAERYAENAVIGNSLFASHGTGLDLRYSFNINTSNKLEANSPLYLKGAIEGGIFVTWPEDPVCVQSLPEKTSSDKVKKLAYLYLGQTDSSLLTFTDKTTSAYRLRLSPTHPVYKWDDVNGCMALYGGNGFATVAKTGNYNDLINKPTIPTVNNGTLTINKADNTSVTFSANQSSDAFLTLNKEVVGLGNVNNTADEDKSVKYATKAGNATYASAAGSAEILVDENGDKLSCGNENTPVFFDGGVSHPCKFSFDTLVGNLKIGDGTLTILSFDGSTKVTFSANQDSDQVLKLTSALVGLGNVNNTADSQKRVQFATSANYALEAEALSFDDTLIDMGSEDQPVYFDLGLPHAGYYIPKLNGNNLTQATSFYAPTSAGISGNILKSTGSGAPVWVSSAPKATADAGGYSFESWYPRNIANLYDDGSGYGTSGYIHFKIGNYRYQICYGQVSGVSGGDATARSVTFPKSFAETPIVIMQEYNMSGSPTTATNSTTGSVAYRNGVSVRQVTATSFQFDKNNSETHGYSWFAIGKGKTS